LPALLFRQLSQIIGSPGQSQQIVSGRCFAL
jgi:hypothetical protein